MTLQIAKHQLTEQCVLMAVTIYLLCDFYSILLLEEEVVLLDGFLWLDHRRRDAGSRELRVTACQCSGHTTDNNSSYSTCHKTHEFSIPYHFHSTSIL